MGQELQNSMFYQVFFPENVSILENTSEENFVLNRLIRFQLEKNESLADKSFVIFDFETTGFDPINDRIIEVGAIKVSKKEILSEFSSLVHPERPLSGASKKITGITEEMLLNQPTIQDILPSFLEFFQGHILVAHNAEFDMGFLKANATRIGITLEWPCFCTLKMARSFLPNLESRSLDGLAKHYGLQFESRHRSIGDVKVTAEVLNRLIDENSTIIQTWNDLAPFRAGS